MAIAAADKKTEFLRTLPGDDVRQIMWGFTDRTDLQMVVQSARAVARGTVARLVANGARNTHEWTDEKAEMLREMDSTGLTAAFLDPEQGGFIEGPKNLALALIAFELAWVDGGAATGSLATCLALGPIHERGTPEQYNEYLRRCAPVQPGEDRVQLRGAFALTEPLPFVGVETGMLNGRVSIAAWEEGTEPVLNVEKRGRFITNMGFANFVTAAVDSGDPRIKGSCFVILEEGDEGEFNRGVPARKLVHQLSSTNDPIFRLRIPASRIVGGYTVKDGVIIPRYNHGEIIEAVFKRTRVTVGLMTAAKLLSAVEPLIRYQRDRFRGSDTVAPGTPRYELGLQQKQDALHRLVDVWATGEAASALGFTTAHMFDKLDPLEKEKDAVLASRGIHGGMAAFKAMRAVEKRALEFLDLQRQPESARDAARWEDLNTDVLVRYALLDSMAGVYCPATKLWNTGHGANVMREAVSLMGGYGITEDCPGFLGHKWMDAQLEATYEGPEAVQRRQLSMTMISPLFLAQLRGMVAELRGIASERPGTGACALATAMQMWLWTVGHLQAAKDADNAALYHSTRQGVTFPLADALGWLLSVHSLIKAVMELEARGPENPVVAEGLEGTLNFYRDLCHAQTARAAGEVGRICAELVYGYNRHPSWDDGEACYRADELIALESVIPGITSVPTDVVDEDGGHPVKAGPCAKAAGLEPFQRLRSKLDGCLTGSSLAKDRAAEALTKVMIPAALDYPA
ncbi:MAG TPA: acyl-CoA dehydrogenase family protein [Bryobacteraceae bacterium]|nr:acyl-CoA dehydrogenase family protein [Bryobacteraceae bacterium]